MSDFYVDLVSNASHDYFPNNSPSNFSTKFAKAIELQGDNWEVGLIDITYPRFHPPTQDTSANIIIYNIENIQPSKTRFTTHTYSFKHLNEEEDFVNVLVADFNKWSISIIGDKSPTFIINSNKIVTLNLSKKSKWNTKHFLYLPKFLLKNLCFKSPLKNNKKIIPFTESTKGFAPYSNPSSTIKPIQVFIYTDIIKHQAVGDTLAPLLRNFSLAADTNNREFQHVLYKTVDRSHFETLEINLLNELGEPISFESDSLTITLHFRKR